jgi:hypothetical protein
VSGFRSAIDELRCEDLAELPDARLEEDFAELQGASEAIEAEKLRRLAEIDRRGSIGRDGMLSAASWLVMRFGLGWAHARERLRWARALRHMPDIARAWEAGEVSSCAVRVLVGAREVDAEAFGRCEADLLRAAQIHPVRDLQRVVAYWRLLVDAEDDRQGGDRRFQRRGLHASTTLQGMVRIDGTLDPETGESLLTALRAACDVQVRSGEGIDERTPAQRRADGLGEICRQWLDMGDRPTVSGERPHVTLTMDLDALRDLQVWGERARAHRSGASGGGPTDRL